MQHPTRLFTFLARFLTVEAGLAVPAIGLYWKRVHIINVTEKGIL
jgi:hypothetical protein